MGFDRCLITSRSENGYPNHQISSQQVIVDIRGRTRIADLSLSSKPLQSLSLEEKYAIRGFNSFTILKNLKDSRNLRFWLSRFY